MALRGGWVARTGSTAANKAKPNSAMPNMPVSLAHTGNCVLLIMNDRAAMR